MTTPRRTPCPHTGDLMYDCRCGHCDTPTASAEWAPIPDTVDDASATCGEWRRTGRNCAELMSAIAIADEWERRCAALVEAGRRIVAAPYGLALGDFDALHEALTNAQRPRPAKK